GRSSRPCTCAAAASRTKQREGRRGKGRVCRAWDVILAGTAGSHWLPKASSGASPDRNASADNLLKCARDPSPALYGDHPHAQRDREHRGLNTLGRFRGRGLSTRLV